MQHCGYSLDGDKGRGHMITEQVSVLHFRFFDLTLEIISLIVNKAYYTYA